MLVPFLYNNSLPADHWREIPAAAPPALSAIAWPPSLALPLESLGLCVYTLMFFLTHSL